VGQKLQSLGEDFQRVDATGAAQAFIRCLDCQQELDRTIAWKRRSFELLRARPGASALDVGCGTGSDALALAGIVGPGGRVLGVDKSEAMVEEARRRARDAGAPVEFRVGEATDLPLPAQSFDAARAERVLVHLGDPARALGEMSRVVRPGGRVVVTEPDMETYFVNVPDRALTRRILGFVCDAFPRGWIGRELPGLFHDAGLAEIEVHGEVQIVTDAAIGERLFDFARVARCGACSPHFVPT
jgi:ubiquinone/menaquinone biosynthesis C-methylase UbiE